MLHLPKADRPPMPSHCWHRADPSHRTPLLLHMGHMHSMCTLDKSQPPNTPQLPLPYIYFFWIFCLGGGASAQHTIPHNMTQHNMQHNMQHNTHSAGLPGTLLGDGKLEWQEV